MSEQATDAIKEYLRLVAAAIKQGNVTEHTHRPALETLLEAMGGTGTNAINARMPTGKPDAYTSMPSNTSVRYRQQFGACTSVATVWPKNDSRIARAAS